MLPSVGHHPDTAITSHTAMYLCFNMPVQSISICVVTLDSLPLYLTVMANRCCTSQPW